MIRTSHNEVHCRLSFLGNVVLLTYYQITPEVARVPGTTTESASMRFLHRRGPSVYILRRDLERYGCSAGCGAAAARSARSERPHTAARLRRPPWRSRGHDAAWSGCGIMAGVRLIWVWDRSWPSTQHVRQPGHPDDRQARMSSARGAVSRRSFGGGRGNCAAARAAWRCGARTPFAAVLAPAQGAAGGDAAEPAGE